MLGYRGFDTEHFEASMKHHSSDRRRLRLLPASRPTAISRRRCLQAMGAAAVGLLAAGCRSRSNAEATLPTAGAATAAPTQVRAEPAARVAIAKAASYDRALVRKQVRALVDGSGGLDDLVKGRPRVAIKVNLTGGTSSKAVPGVPPIESFVTHPEVVRALGEAVREAGARELFIVEAVYERASYSQWGYDDVAKALGATLIDLNDPHPYGEFATVPVGQNAFIYESFSFTAATRRTPTVHCSMERRARPASGCHASSWISTARARSTWRCWMASRLSRVARGHGSIP